MCIAGVDWGSIGQAMNIAGGIYSTYQSVGEGRAMRQYYDMMAKMQETQARITRETGARQIGEVKEFAKRFRETQRAAMAANGISLDSATMEDILSDTERQATLDEMAIRYEAALRAWDLENQAVFSRAAGQNAYRAGIMQGFATLLGTAGQVADNWYRLGKTGAWYYGKQNPKAAYYGGQRPHPGSRQGGY